MSTPGPAKRAVLVYLPDAFANGEKPDRITEFLERHGYRVERCATGSLTRLGPGAASKLPRPTPTGSLAYFFEALYTLCSARGTRRSRAVAARALEQLITLRGRLLARRLRGGGYDLLVCESNLDQGLFLRERVAAVQVLDLPAPLAEELYHGGVLDEAGLARLRRLERRSYAAADHLAFHWHTYSAYVQATKYRGSNFIELGYGAPVRAEGLRAQHATPPRIVFLGYLSGYWVNLPLLEQLCALYPHIDIYGGPPPTGPLARHYRGYSPDAAGRSGKDVLADYQFGLVTISDDELRRHSFSSKHLDYISYGLPVLTPAWRCDPVLEASSVYYTAETFLDRIDALTPADAWQAKSEAALAAAAELSWDAALKPLIHLGAHRARTGARRGPDTV